MQQFWLNYVRNLEIEVLGIYPDRDPTNPKVLLPKGRAHIRINKLGVEIRGIAYGKRTYGKQGKGRKRWFVKRLGELHPLKDGSTVFVPTVIFFKNHLEIWRAISKLILETLRANPLPYENKARIFPFDKLPNRIQPPPPGEPCPSGPPWTEVVEKYKIQLINIDSKTEGIPEAGTKERGSCHVYLPTFGVEIKNIRYKTSHNWTKDFIVVRPAATFMNAEGEEELAPTVSFMENSRLVWRAIA
ncbi:MAG: hypothetical protein AAF443_00260, partial [Chlamydiota bacterium]